MSEKQRFWQLWSEVWSYAEDNMLDTDSINRLASVVEDPALVVGAGQGLLVEQLHNKGLKVDGIDSEPKMIEFARKRRGLELILADGRQMPFADNTYRTSIIATGVVDWLDDQEQIRSILTEARRVTEDAGKVLVAFYRFGSAAEQVMRLAGLITDDERWHWKQTFQAMRMTPVELLRTVKAKGDVSYLSALAKLIKLRFLAPAKEKKAAKRWSRLWKEAADPEKLIDCTPDSLPYRTEVQIRSLFENIDIPIREVLGFESCTVVLV